MFTESADPGLDAHALVVHRRLSKQDNTALVLFVHGLTGQRYGYWGEFCRFVFEDFTTCDIGLYAYRTAWKRRILRTPTIELEAEAETFVGTLHTAKRYTSVFLIAHSMGGILAKGAIAQLLQARDLRTLRRIAGLLLIASPQAGSLRVPRVLSWFSPDARALRLHNAFVRRIDDAIRSNLTISDEAPRRSAKLLPTWALLSEEDYWVDPMSASLGVPQAQRRTIRGAHGDLCAPERKTDDSYLYATECLRRIFSSEVTAPASEREIGHRLATPEDAPLIANYAVRMFGPAVSSEEEIEALIRHDAECFQVVNRITITGLMRTERLVGYFCVLRLSEEATEAIATGRLMGSNIDVPHLATASSPGSIYVGAVAADRYREKAYVLAELRAYLSELLKDLRVPIYARPVTPDGLRLVRRHDFKPVSQGGLQHMYVRRHVDQGASRGARVRRAVKEEEDVS